MKRTAILLMLITILSKILGFVRDIILSYFYGASGISDAYLISLIIPEVIFSSVWIGLYTGYIPMYSKIEQDHGALEGNKYTNNLINILLIICTVMLIIGQGFTDQIVKTFASGFEGETLELAIKFTRISLLGIHFTSMVCIFSGFLQLKNNYIIPALTGFPLNIFIICSILISVKSSILVLSIGVIIGTASQLIILIPAIYKKGYKYKITLDIKDEHIKKMIWIALPVIIGLSVNQINILVDITLASRIAVGGISALDYANRLSGFVQGLFVVSIATVMYPSISKMVAEDNISGLKKSVSEAISSINILVIPATVGFMIFAEPVVKLLFGRGAFGPSAIAMTSNALFFYSIGMLGFGHKDILSRAFYSMQDTKTPTIIIAISVVINIVLSIVLSKYMGTDGLALATSISAITCTVLLFVSFRKKIGSFGMKCIIISFVKVLFSSLMMGAIAKFSFISLINFIGIGLSLVISASIGVLVYIIFIYFMKIDEVDSIINAVKLRLKKM